MARDRLAEGGSLASHRPDDGERNADSRTLSLVWPPPSIFGSKSLNFKSLRLFARCLVARRSSPCRCRRPARRRPRPLEGARVIVKYKADSPLLRRETLAAGTQRLTGREALAQRIGLALRAGADVGERTQVLFASGMTSQQLAARLARESDIEYAVPDERRHRLAAPNDPLYFTGPPITGTSGGPAAGQWYLRAPTTRAAIGDQCRGGVELHVRQPQRRRGGASTRACASITRISCAWRTAATCCRATT